jgi:zinc protease
MLTAGMDVIAEAVRSVVPETTAVIRRLRDRGPDPTELRDDIAAQIRRYRSQPVDQWLPFLAARDALIDHPVTRSLDELVAEEEAVTGEQIQQAARSMWSDLLVSVDPAGSGDPQLTWMNGPPEPGPAPAGRKFRPAGSPATKGALIVGQTSTQLQVEGNKVEAAYDDLAAMITFPDGGRQLIREDGFQVTLEPTLWRKGQQAVALVDSAVPRPLHIPLPERSADRIPQDKVRRIDKVRAWTNSPKVWIPFLVVVIILGALAIDTEDIPGILTRVLVVAAAVTVITLFKQYRSGRKS